MALGVVQKPESVEVDQCDADRESIRPRALDLLGEMAHEGAMVEGACQGISTACLDESRGLSVEPALRASKDEEEDDRNDDRPGDRDDHDVAAKIVEARQDRSRIAPDRGYEDDLVALPEGKVLAKKGRRVESSGADFGLRRPDNGDLGGGPGDRVRKRRSRRDCRADRRGVARNEDPPIGQPEVNAKDLALAGERRDERVEAGDLSGRWVLLLHDRRVDALVDKPTDRRDVAADDPVQGRARGVDRDHEGLGRRRDPDDPEQDAEDDQKQDRAPWPGPGSKHALLDTPMQECSVWVGEVGSPTQTMVPPVQAMVNVVRRDAASFAMRKNGFMHNQLDEQPVIVVVGSLNIDLVAYTARVPCAGETVIGDKFVMGFGGKGANQAVMAARLRARVSMVGALGDDVYAGMTLENLAAQGVDSTHVARVAGSSGVAPIWVEPDGTNRIIVVPGANAEVDAQVAAAALRSMTAVDVVIGQLEIPQAVTASAFRAAQELGAVTILNPAPAAALDPDLLEVAGWLIPNETEFAVLAGINGFDPSDDAPLIAFAGGIRPRLLVTLGSRGAALVTRAGSVERVPAVPVKAVDTTGAGDAFVGAFAFGLAAGLDEVRAVLLGIACASDSVTRTGTQSSFASREGAAAIVARVLAGATLGRCPTTPRRAPSRRPHRA